ncbi:MAG: heme-copper oxidase subunit III [Chloroflexi bacterium]|nr:heme-copper oxidase subunit III [Chloroflexota bacterium]
MNQTNVHERRLTRAAEEGNLNRKYGFWIFLSSEFLIFAGLIGAFVMTRASVFRSTSSLEEFVQKWWEANTFSLALVSINTFVLLASSLFVVLAIDAARRDDQRGLVRWLAATIVMGVIFLGGQAVEYTLLVSEGHTYFNNADAFASAFFTLTGFHGLHVFVGTLICIGVLQRARKNAYWSGNFTTVEIFGLFWHFVDLVWVLIFTIVYLT